MFAANMMQERGQRLAYLLDAASIETFLCLGTPLDLTICGTLVGWRVCKEKILNISSLLYEKNNIYYMDLLDDSDNVL